MVLMLDTKSLKGITAPIHERDINRVALACLPAIRAMFKGMGLADDRCDDATQDAHIALVVNGQLATWKGGGSVQTFALQVAKCRFLDSVRKVAERVSAARESMPSESGDWGDDCTRHVTDHGASVAIPNAMDLRALHQAINFLEGRVRDVAESYARTGSLKDTAAELGISHATVCRVFNNEVVPRLRELLA